MKDKEEIEILTADATSGDPTAQNTIGCAYYSGDGVVKDYAKALDWFRKSAAQNNRFACFNVGMCYEHGQGVKKDIYKAISWYEKASELGFADGALALGRLYETGFKPSLLEESLLGTKSLEAAPDEAFYWYYKSSTADEGLFNLARCYESGFGTPINLRKAVEIYRNLDLKLAQERLNKILETFNPEKETRLSTLTLFSRNPNRVIGVYANASSREIKANIAKLEAYTKVGKSISFPLDNYLPVAISARKLYHSELLNTLKSKLINCGSGNSGSILSWRKRLENSIRLQEFKLNDILSVSGNGNERDEAISRTPESIGRAMSDLESDETRILNALFWFHCHTDEDKKAFEQIRCGRWDEAISIWDNSDSYSAYINKAVMEWYNRNDCFAVRNLIAIISSDDKRADFLSAINIPANSYSANDIKRILWDGLFSKFPYTERAIDWHTLGSELDFTALPGCGFDEEDNSYILSKACEEIATPLNELLSKAKSWDGIDFVTGSQLHNKLFLEGKTIIRRIEHLVGQHDSHFIKISDEVALELLEYAIAHNNNCKEWSAPATALYLGQWAKKIAVSEILRNRCQENIEIFEKNKRIAATEHILEAIDEKFSVQERYPPTYQVVETMIRDSELNLALLKKEIGDSSPQYIDASSGLVNRILNVLIKVYNSEGIIISTNNALHLMGKLESFTMSRDTRTRFDRNKDIIERNRQSFKSGGHNTSSHTRTRFNHSDMFRDLERRFRDSEDHLTTKRVRKAKWLLTCAFSLVIAGLIINLSINGEWFLENHPWWTITVGVDICILLICIIVSWEAESANENGIFRRSFRWGSKDDVKTRRIHKFWATIASLAVIGLLFWYLSWGNNFSYFWEKQPWWICVCVASLILLNIFIIAMWFLEAQRDPEHLEVLLLDFDEIDRTSDFSNAGCFLLIPLLPYYFIMFPFKLATLIR